MCACIYVYSLTYIHTYIHIDTYKHIHYIHIHIYSISLKGAQQASLKVSGLDKFVVFSRVPIL